MLMASVSGQIGWPEGSLAEALRSDWFSAQKSTSVAASYRSCTIAAAAISAVIATADWLKCWRRPGVVMPHRLRTGHPLK